MGFTQINLHHSKGALAVLAKSMGMVHTCITLMQESWLYRAALEALRPRINFSSLPQSTKPIAVKGLKAQLMPNFCSRDVAAIVMDLRRSNTGETRKIVHQYQRLGQEASGVLATDLLATDLKILNRDNEPSLQNARDRRKVELCIDHLQRALIDMYSRLCRILARNPSSNLQAIRLPNGDVVSDERCLVLLETNFPDFKREVDIRLRAHGCDWELTASIIKPERVMWAVKIFKPFKSADGIFPVLLQEGLVDFRFRFLVVCPVVIWRVYFAE
ncbi:hypothetical protein ACFW04_014326 [Cataglyphis niger]